MKGEIRLLTISAQTLFSNNGTPIDLLEIQMKSEGWLFPDENLLNVLSDGFNLKRQHLQGEENLYSDFPEEWSEEDYIDYERRKNETCII